MKKLLLGLGTVSLLTLPLLAVVSCSSTELVDLKITAIPVSQEIITNSIKEYKAAITHEARAKSLEKTFNFVNNTDIKNVTVYLDETTLGKESITLTANKGFVFGLVVEGQEPVLSISSTVAPVLPPVVGNVDLKITSKPNTQVVLDGSIILLNDVTVVEGDRVNILNAHFNGVTSKNFNNFTIVATHTVGDVLGTITLTAKDGFIFGESKTLVSTVAPVLPVK